MFRRFLVLQIAFLFLISSSEYLFAARKEIYSPVIAVPSLPISQSKSAVKRAINHRFQIYEILSENDDSFVFSFTVRKHSAKNKVKFSNTSIEFKFISCENLDFKVKDGKYLIHKNYNVWMRNLEEDIGVELLKPPSDGDPLDPAATQPAQPSGPDPGVKEGETHIHVLRQKSMVGAMMTVSVGINDRLIAQLKSSTYCKSVEKAGPITVNILQASTVVAAVAVDDRPGKAVYLLYNYKRGTVTEIPRTEALGYLEKYEEVPILTVPKPNPAYVVGLMNPGTFDDALMSNTDDVLEPDADHAVMTFVGDYEKYISVPVGIWEVGEFLGSLNGRSLFQIKVAPGKHYFFAKYEHWSVLEAEVEAGKRYFAQVTITKGWTQAHVRILPVKMDTEASEFERWMGGFEKLKFDGEHLKPPIASRIEAAMPFIEEAMQNVENGLHETRVLSASDSR